MGRKSLFHYLIAFFLIGLGIMLVLENIGVLSINVKIAWYYLYPLFFLIIGFKWLIDKLKQRGGSFFFGSLFFIFGVLLILDRLDVITFYFTDMFKLWPLLIVYIGFELLRGSHMRRKKSFFKDSTYDFSNKGSFFAAGNFEYNQPNWKVEPMHFKSFAGDFYFDFSKAYIPEEKTPITINSLAGDVHILIPEQVEFRLEASVIAGEIIVSGQTTDGINRYTTFETPHYESSTQKLDLSITLKAGSIRVDSV